MLEAIPKKHPSSFLSAKPPRAIGAMLNVNLNLERMSQTSKVVMVGSKENPTELVQISTKNAERAFIRVEEESWSSTGECVTTVGFLRGQTDKLKQRVERMDWKVGMELPCGVRIQESFERFYEGQEPKRKGKDGEVILKQGAPVYRQVVVSPVLEGSLYEWIGATTPPEVKQQAHEGADETNALIEDEPATEAKK